MIGQKKRDKVLIVEDDAATGHLLGTVLRRRGYVPLHAREGDAAARLAKQYQGEIALILCDVVLKFESGGSVVSRVRAHCSGVRALFISGLPLDILYKNNLLELPDLADGENFHLQKPFAPGSLLKVVDQIMERDAPRPTIEEDAFDVSAVWPERRNYYACAAY
jgi:DNA-binding response OmpR family regulator